jgi:hypothetical protein
MEVLNLNFGRVIKKDTTFWNSKYGIEYQIPHPYRAPPPTFIYKDTTYEILYGFQMWLEDWKTKIANDISSTGYQLNDTIKKRDVLISQLVSFGKSRAEAEAQIDSLINQYKERIARLQSILDAITSDLNKLNSMIESWRRQQPPPPTPTPKPAPAPTGMQATQVAQKYVEQVKTPPPPPPPPTLFEPYPAPPKVEVAPPVATTITPPAPPILPTLEEVGLGAGVLLLLLLIFMK